MMYRGNTAPQNFSQNSPKILHYLGTIYLLSITANNNKQCHERKGKGYFNSYYRYFGGSGVI